MMLGKKYKPTLLNGIWSLCGLVLSTLPSTGLADAPVVFGRDILPILSDNCFRCHGPDAKMRKAKLRLDTRDGALKVITPGRSTESELILRVTASDPDQVMPPPKTKRKLTPAQIAALRRWIDQGAAWGKHWAYETPRRPAIPLVKNPAWCRNEIDRFVLARLEHEGLSPSSEATKEALIRRVTLDLTGLPPTLEEIDAFVGDSAPDAYDKLVDRLLSSERYGEHMAMDWLDAARFADTNGYQNDFERTMWPWRDWIIAAYNKNMPFDRFVVEQIAGDMLPGATLSQKIASGFNRNNRTVTEAGSIDEEWLVENVVDRVETTATVFLGLTMGCGRCHDHKYDPITQKDFYRFFAFFNNVNEKGVYTEQRGNVAPLVSVPGPEDMKKLKEFDAAIARAEADLRARESATAELMKKWEQEQLANLPRALPAGLALHVPLAGDLAIRGQGSTGQARWKGSGRPAWRDGLFGKALVLDGKDDSFLDAGPGLHLERSDKFSYGGWIQPQGSGAILSKMDDAAAYRGFDLLLQNGKLEVHLVNIWPSNAIKVSTRSTLPKDAWAHVMMTYDGSGKARGITIYVNGKAEPLEINNDNLAGTMATAQPLRLGKRSTAFPFHGALADIRFYRRTLAPDEVKAVVFDAWRPILQLAPGRRSPEQKKALASLFRQNSPELRKAEGEVARLRQARIEYQKKIPTTMVMEERRQRRDTYLLKRGRYDMADKSEKLRPDVPAFLPPLPRHAPHNRLGLAYWLVDAANPLTARVAVNRYWQQSFGTGLVKTSEDFGVRGELPSHPELLDWLATEFVRSGWNIKAMRKRIVTSATYRQTSRCSPELVARDPENRLLGRGPRFRLAAETVRDNALAISGLLVEKTGGPSVKPYQPAGLWDELAGGAASVYVQDKGDRLYRRSLYIYRKRTVPHPAMATFDAPSREICQVKRQRTNTPLQALELLNDVTYVEAARQLGQRLLIEGGKTPEQRLTYAFRRATARRPDARELKVLLGGLEKYRSVYRANPNAAQQWIRHGESPLDERLDRVELAAHAAMASIILNLDETICIE
jgi:mono/diheme cytochrome c family protein